MTRLGMDADEVERVAIALHEKSGQILATMSQIGQLVDQAVHVWDGDDARHFYEEWTGQHRLALQRLAEAIEMLSHGARENAERQREASRAH
ncbi:MAG: hypothetical protein U0Q21_14135 [Dermatophilaceae bacterium]